jgi:hypothetical protein
VREQRRCTFLERAGFAPEDRLAVVLIHKPTHAVVQRISPVKNIAAPVFQDWLRERNALQQFQIYVSLNPLRADSLGRTKKDIAEIRHIFLDFDKEADTRMRELLRRPDLPKPTSLINSSHNHWQVLWRVTGFTTVQAEALQRGLARDAGADIAATDCSRVLRYPGFLNHKYSPPWRVSAQHFAKQSEITPEHFPPAAYLYELQPALLPAVARSRPQGGALSQSERDWAYAKRSLALGRPAEQVIAAIAANRSDKPNPLYYARLTVHKAAIAVANDPRSAKYMKAKS